MAISRIFDISNRSMQTYQKAIDLTANNITNAANPNYSRRQVSLTEAKTQSLNGIQWGAGVTVGGVQRIRDNFVDRELIIANQDYSKYNKKAWVYDRVEQLFNETTGAGLTQSLSDFFASFNELSANPASVPSRNKIITAAQNLNTKISEIYDGIDTITTDVKLEFDTIVDTVNTYTKQLKDLNSKISSAHRTGNNASDLEDTRSEILDKLSEKVNINVQYDEFNSASVSIGGVIAVDAMHQTDFASKLENGKLKLVIPEREVSALLNSGELGALAEVYNNEMSEYKTNLDNIFNSLVDSVNTIHKTGYNVKTPPQTGIDFFQEFSNGELIINSLVESDSTNIAASNDGTAGNSDIALEIASLADQTIMNGYTFNQQYVNMLTDIGNRAQSADKAVESNQLVKEQLVNQRSQYSGVSIDEEMSNVILFQKSYDASARLVKIADEMLDVLMNMV